MLHVLSVANLENIKHIRVQEKTSSPSYRQRSPNTTRSISRPSQVNQAETRSLSTNGKQYRGKSCKPEASSKFIDSSHKNDQKLHKENEENNKDKGSGIDIRVQEVGEINKTSPIKNEGKKRENKSGLDCNSDFIPTSEHSTITEKRSQKVIPNIKTTYNKTTSKTKNTNLEVEWAHLKTPPNTRKLIVKSPSQTSCPTKSISSQLSSQNNTLGKSSSTRKIAQKARTTNLALSINIAQSANISHSAAKHDRETEEDKRSKVTKQRGRAVFNSFYALLTFGEWTKMITQLWHLMMYYSIILILGHNNILSHVLLLLTKLTTNLFNQDYF